MSRRPPPAPRRVLEEGDIGFDEIEMVVFQIAFFQLVNMEIFEMFFAFGNLLAGPASAFAGAGGPI